MEKCKNCTCGSNENVVTPTIVLNITFNDNRMDEDASTYVEHVLMEGNDEYVDHVIDLKSDDTIEE